jgi:hypothetical protein
MISQLLANMLVLLYSLMISQLLANMLSEATAASSALEFVIAYG